MTRCDPTPRELVARLGPHPVTRLGIDLDTPAGRGRWWPVALVLGSGAPQEAALSACERLGAAGLAEPAALAGADAGSLPPLLAELGQGRVEAVAVRLVRSTRALAAGGLAPGDALDRIAAGADGLEALGTGLVRLSRGVGRATALRFLRPLRDVWASAADVPLAPSARSAALHLGWLAEDLDPLVEARVLRALDEGEAGAPDPIDVEAALERLGARACRRERPDRCPLGRDCPVLRV